MGHDYEKSKKKATQIILILAAITIAEVLFALAGKGHIVEGWHVPVALMAGVMIIMSLVKAYLIVYEFMHMKYEMPSFVKSVLVPTLLLTWAIFAFFKEGDYWKMRRGLIDDKNNDREQVDKTNKQEGALFIIKEENQH